MDAGQRVYDEKYCSDLLQDLPDPPLVAVTLEDKKRAKDFVANQKSLVDNLHRGGGSTSFEKAKKRTEQLEKANRNKTIKLE